MKMSKNELIYAHLLRCANIKYIFPVKRFILSDGKSYRPDFYLPERNEYIEVVGTRSAFHANKIKIKKFLKEHRVHYSIVDFERNQYIENFVKTIKRVEYHTLYELLWNFYLQNIKN